MDIDVRLLREEDLPFLTALQRANRAFLAPWEPARPDDFFTTEQQRTQLANALSAYRAGSMMPLVILEDGDIVGPDQPAQHRPRRPAVRRPRILGERSP